MALIRCRECRKEVSDSAKVCPHCGVRGVKPIPEKEKTPIYVKIALLVIVVGLIIGGCYFWFDPRYNFQRNKFIEEYNKRENELSTPKAAAEAEKIRREAEESAKQK